MSQVIKTYNGRFTLSDDSHGPQAVGLNYARMREYLRKVQINEIWVLQSSTNANKGGRLSHAKKVPGDWWEHPFWTSKIV